MIQNVKSYCFHLVLFIFAIALCTLSNAKITYADVEGSIFEKANQADILIPDNSQDLVDIAPDAGDNDPYLLNPGDHLRIFVFNVDELSGEFRVSGAGNITLPLIGEIYTEGLDKHALQNIITQKLINGGYFNDPKVTVEVIALQPFYILGEVKNPGSYEYHSDMDIFKAIAVAGGYTPRAAKKKIIIIRRIHDEKVEILANETTPILPGDSIKVKQRFF